MTTEQKVDAITLTFGDCMENHAGMQIVGSMAEHGYTFDDLKRIKKEFKKLGGVAIMYNLKKLLDEPDREQAEDAYFLVLKNAVNVFEEDLSKELYEEHCKLDYDKHYFDTRRQRVLNKLARWNLCFDDIAQEADYENKKGTIVAYDDVPFTKKLRGIIANMTGDANLKLEANYYYDITKTGIGYHGDSERVKVVGVRIGSDNKMTYRWYRDGQQVGAKFETTLSDGDIYIMSEKAVGTDWKQRNKLTLRHAAGCSKYTD
jgi:hypothetical protein